MSGHERGFTLIEITAGIVLLGLLLSGVYTVAIGTLRARQKIDELSALNTAGPKVLDLIEKDLRSAYLHGIKDNRAFVAQRQSVGGEDAVILDLVTTTNSKISEETDGRVVRSDVTEIGYRLRRSDDLPNMLELYRREQFFFDDDLQRGGDYYLVYDRVRSLAIDWYEPPEAGQSSRAKEDGVEDWDSEDKGFLPRAARITLELGPPEGIRADLENDERRWKFVRWVLLPTAYDKAPEEGEGPQQPQQPGR